MEDEKLVSLHKGLMEAYRETLRQSDRLDMLNRAFVHHVVATSSRELAGYLRTRFDAGALANETVEFSRELERNDAVAGVVSFTQALAEANLGAIWKYIVGGGLVALLTVIFAKVGGAVAFIGPGAIVGTILVLLNTGAASELLDSLRGPAAARDLLEKTLDKPEKELFELTNGRPPARPAFVVAGAIKVTFALVVLFLLLLLGAFISAH